MKFEELVLRKINIFIVLFIIKPVHFYIFWIILPRPDSDMKKYGTCTRKHFTEKKELKNRLKVFFARSKNEWVYLNFSTKKLDLFAKIALN